MNDDLAKAVQELFVAGRELATLVQEDVDACGNSPPHPADCPDCRRQREALFTWSQKVWATRKALAIAPQLTDRDLPDHTAFQHSLDGGDDVLCHLPNLPTCRCTPTPLVVDDVGEGRLDQVDEKTLADYLEQVEHAKGFHGGDDCDDGLFRDVDIGRHRADIRFLSDQFGELQRAREKFPRPNLNMVALVEEVGELAKALLDEPYNNVRREAVQVAVMAMRVAVDGDPTLDDHRLGRQLDLLQPASDIRSVPIP